MPRVAPRMEQLVRAQRARELGVARMFETSDTARLEDFVIALQELPYQAKPSSAMLPGFLDGVENVGKLAGRHFHPNVDRQLSLVKTGG
jgi:predicted glycosyltransferase